MVWAPDYVTKAEMQSHERIGDDDAEIQEKITAASRAVDEWCNRQFGKVDAPVQRFYEHTSAYVLDGFWVVDVEDVQDVTGLAVTVDGIAVTGYTPLPRNAAADGKPYIRLRLPDRPCGEIAVTALWGWTAVPAAVKTATKLQASRWLFRRDAPHGIAGSPDFGGGDLRLLSRLDPDVGPSLAGLVRARRPR